MLIKFIKLCLIFILIGGGIILYNNREVRDRFVSYVQSFAPDFKDVKGINTDKAAEIIPNQLKTEAEKKAKNMKISNFLDIFDQTQKIAIEFRSFQEYVKKEASNLIKKK